MTRLVTIFTGQWADLSLETIAAKAKAWGYDGLELACWGDHVEVEKAANDKTYCARQRGILEKHGLKLYAISNHLAGQLTCDINDRRSHAFAPKELHGKPEEIRKWAIQQMKLTARAAKNFGVTTVNGFTGSPTWDSWYGFPPVSPEDVEAGYKYVAATWGPILDVYKECGVRFALEVHPTEIAYDFHTAAKILQYLGDRPEFGFNFDPSHFHWQGVDPAGFVREFGKKIYHVHMKDCIIRRDGRSGILSSQLPFGDSRRGWEFRSPGRGQINFEEIIRALNDVNYQGPLSVEWEDAGMDREAGASEAVGYVKKLDFKSSNVKFDAAFEKK
ncbi:MAG: sugar phosphate isomerase/epimerase [Planctomycetes bacterium]|nr:sugar phosphate isomerase/epimerase [Planctomycetota bacterium]